eukprot:TRINITY_DN2160_c0_g1_i3.p1 TRINITY_DN2160_c0_g1~~TRINITY_DN2160_c0_g1_i3.p1  ORF type:complete len:336 (-),score=157.56 TRINITY_DN2160_c0_g1_i3:91-1098(-)
MAKVAAPFAPIVNFISKSNQPDKPPRTVRRIMESVVDIHAKAVLPEFVTPQQQLINQTKKLNLSPNVKAPAFASKRRVLLYATCLSNYHLPSIGLAAISMLNHAGVEVKIFYDECCGMPQFEQGHVGQVSLRASNLATKLSEYIEQKYDIVSLVASCTLMFKHEYPTLLPDNEDIKKLSNNSYDISEYLVNIAHKEGLPENIANVCAKVTLHNACHSKSQNMGFKSKEMLSLIPGLEILTVDRCSGHGGSFGVHKKTFPIAMEVGKFAFKQVLRNSKEANEKEKKHFIASDCPLAVDHLIQGISKDIQSFEQKPIKCHPIEILAAAYGIHTILTN